MLGRERKLFDSWLCRAFADARQNVFRIRPVERILRHCGAIAVNPTGSDHAGQQFRSMEK